MKLIPQDNTTVHLVFTVFANCSLTIKLVIVNQHLLHRWSGNLSTSNLCTTDTRGRAPTFTDGSRRTEGTRTRVCGQSVGIRLSISLGKHSTVFQAEEYAILARAFEVQTKTRRELRQYLL
jgi:hypothetical protein